VVSARNGTTSRAIRRRAIPVFVFWTPKGELLFREIALTARRDRVMIWNPETGRVRMAFERPAGPPPDMMLDITPAALEPGGRRVALIYTRRAPLARPPTANCGWWTWPPAGSGCSIERQRSAHVWRRGRIYLTQHNDQLWSSSPDRGGLRRESYLPPAEKGEAR